MTCPSPHRSLVLLAALVLLVAACGSSDDGDSETSTTATLPANVDFELFASDEGAGCALYVSVSEDSVGSDTDLRQMIWTGVVSTDAVECDFSDVIEVGLITVDGLDSYNQPDWSSAIEHGFFSVEGWDALVEDCYVLPIDEPCASQLESTFAE